MNDSVFEAVETSSRILRLDFSSIGLPKLAEEQDFSEEQIQAVGVVFKHLQNKKVDTTIHTLLKMSRLPLKDPKTFENFDFSVIKGRDANRLKTLPSLSAIYAHQESGVHWSGWNRQDTSCAGFWLCVLPARNKDLFH